jgi:hypothetical protein
MALKISPRPIQRLRGLRQASLVDLSEPVA